MIIAKEIDVCDWLRRLRLAMPSTPGYAVCVKCEKPKCKKALQEMCVCSRVVGQKSNVGTSGGGRLMHCRCSIAERSVCKQKISFNKMQ